MKAFQTAISIPYALQLLLSCVKPLKPVDGLLELGLILGAYRSTSQVVPSDLMLSGKVGACVGSMSSYLVIMCCYHVIVGSDHV